MSREFRSVRDVMKSRRRVTVRGEPEWCKEGEREGKGG